MVRITTVAIVLAALSGADAFAPATFGVKSSTSLEASKMAEVRSAVDGLTKDNFSDTLTQIEPFLTQEAGATIYKKSLRRIARAAKHLGTEVPEGYAKEAKATEKKRVKQDEFIKVKEEERMAAEAEAADAAAEAAEAEAAEEEAPAEE